MTHAHQMLFNILL